MKRAFTLFLAFILVNAASAQTTWTNRYDSGTEFNDYANAIALDSSGNAYVTGYSLKTSLSTGAYLTIKYSSTGTMVWADTFNGSANKINQGIAIAVDTNGNAYVTGGSTGASSGMDYATIKYSTAGVPLWTNTYNGPGNGFDQASAIAVDTNGNAYVTGGSTGTGSSSDYATIKYSTAGVPQWINIYNGPGNGSDFANALAVDASGNVYVTGSSTGSGSGLDYATIKYSSSGLTQWLNRYSSPGSNPDEASAIAVDPDGNTYVTGQSTIGGITVYATIKYSSASGAVWTNFYSGPGNNNDKATAIAVDAGGDAYVTGSSVPASGTYFAVTIKYSSAGVPLWTNSYNGIPGGNDQAKAIAVDGNGNVYITGFSLINGSATSYYTTVAYTGAGVPVWTNLYSGPGNNNDEAVAITVDASGDIFETGFSGSSSGGSDYATIKYSAMPANASLVILTTDGNFGIKNGLFGFNYTAPSGSNVLIQASSNLMAWLPLKTNPPASSPVYFSDPQSSGTGNRFYRATFWP